jgi:hypothetical protein
MWPHVTWQLLKSRDVPSHSQELIILFRVNGGQQTLPATHEIQPRNDETPPCYQFLLREQKHQI